METLLLLVLDLCGTLSRGPVAASELATGLGAVESEGRSAVYVRPAAAALERVIVSRDRSSGETRSVELVLASGVTLTVAELTGAFGAHAEPPKVSWDAPTRLRFEHDPGPALPRRCVISAALGEGAAADGQAAVVSLTLIPEGR